jgi:hypothetical protein
MDEFTEMTQEEAVDVLGTIGFMPADKRDVMRDSNPLVEMVKDSCSEGTTRVRAVGVVGTKRAVVLEEDSSSGICRVVSDWISLGKLSVKFYDEKYPSSSGGVTVT